MLDFNDDPAEASIDSIAQRDAVRSDLLARLESVLFTLFPAGKKRRGKFLIGDVLGSPGDSLEVVLDGEKSGLWTDRATGDGGDIFDLIRFYRLWPAHVHQAAEHRANAGSHGVGDGRCLGFVLHFPLRRRLAVLRGVGQMAGVDRQPLAAR